MFGIEQLDQSIQGWASSLGWPLEGFLRLLLAAFLGGLLGLEREVRRRHAGFRTFLLVCLGSALVMLVSTRLAFFTWPAQPQTGVEINVDPGRIAYGVMTGIGFLGAGTIIQRRDKVRGLTTAAGIWCVAAIGLAAGFGMYLLALFATLLVLVTLWLLNYLEYWLPRTRIRSIVIRTRFRPTVIEDTIKHLERFGKLALDDISLTRVPNSEEVDVSLKLYFNERQGHQLDGHLDEVEGYRLMESKVQQ